MGEENERRWMRKGGGQKKSVMNESIIYRVYREGRGGEEMERGRKGERLGARIRRMNSGAEK